MEAFARMVLLLVVVLAVVQLTTGGWPRLRLWLSTKFIGVPAKAA